MTTSTWRPPQEPTAIRNPKDWWKFDGNFLELGAVDVAGLRPAVMALDEACWAEEVLRTRLSEYLNAIILLQHDRQQRRRHRLWEALDCPRHLGPLLARLGDRYGEGEPVLVTLTRLRGDTTIPMHRDGPQLQPPWPDRAPPFSRRVHVPIVTSPEVVFEIAGERRHLAAGTATEINNWREHRVLNDGAGDRIHLIVDWGTRDQLPGLRGEG